ncbi:hypothetical protein FOCC_FOCC013361 [Frankliniella occidentalis]|nr:hypothetical protein FOCC_FOCC013361 [Frankliniella occidentalis]
MSACSCKAATNLGHPSPWITVTQDLPRDLPPPAADLPTDISHLLTAAHARHPRRRHAHGRPLRPGRHAALRLHRPDRALRAAQAALHLQDAARRARPEGQVRAGRAVPAAQQRGRRALHRIPGQTHRGAPSSLPDGLQGGAHRSGVRRNGDQHPARLPRRHQRLHPRRARPRLRL